ncbi:MAG TPA: hypothetical protein VF824_03890 [Thermoanaerobaculia bacterium]|jgi:hypothetical protein
MNARIAVLASLLVGLSLSGSVSASSPRYIYRHNGKSYLVIDGTYPESMKSVASITDRYPGDFIWVRDARGAWLIRDAGVLAEAARAYAELDAMHPELEALEAKIRPYERRAEEVERELDEVSDSFDDEDLPKAERTRNERRMRELEQRLREAELAYKPMERNLETLERRADALEAIAEKKLERIMQRAIADGKAERVQ